MESDRQEFMDWCEDAGGEVDDKIRTNLTVCEHGSDETGEYKGKVILKGHGRNSEVSIPGSWSGWHSGLTDVTNRDGELLLEGRDNGKITSRSDGFEYFYHEDDDVAPEVEEMHESFAY